jgi:hypothetical protein
MSKPGKICNFSTVFGIARTIIIIGQGKTILFLHGKNGCENLTGYTFRVGYTYRAACIFTKYKIGGEGVSGPLQ